MTFRLVNKQEIFLYPAKTENHLFKNMHSDHINTFCEHLSEYSKIAYEDIMGISTEKPFQRSLTTKQPKKGHPLLSKIIKRRTTKENIENYMK